MRTSIYELLTIVLLLGGISPIFAQQKVGSNPTSINANAAFEVEHTAKGMLLPRVELTSTSAALPLSEHVAGMLVYNTAAPASGDVTPGLYYNTGSAWVRVPSSTNTNLYNADGTLTGNRVVRQAGYSLNFQPGSSTNSYLGFVTGHTPSNVRLFGSDTLEFQTASNPYQMVLNTNGNVGIGTANPAAKLHVAGVARMSLNATNSGYIEFSRTGASAPARDGYIGYGSGSGGIHLASEVSGQALDLRANNGNILLLPGTGYVGIGTSTPVAPLSLIGSGGIHLADGYSNGLFGLRIQGVDNGSTGHDFHVKTRNTAVGTFTSSLVVKSSGNVGVGTVSPTERLTVGSTTGNPISFNVTNGDGNFRIGVAGAVGHYGAIAQGDVTVENVSNKGIGFFTNGSMRVYVSNTGNVGIGTSAPSEVLDVNGNIRCNAVILTSDATLKQDISVLSNVLPSLLQIGAYSYHWKDPSASPDLQYGVMAQEIEKIFPHLVVTHDDHKAVNYSQLIPLLIQAIKEQQIQIESLQHRNKRIRLGKERK